MYSLRDDTNINVTRHQDLLHRSQHGDPTTPLKTRVTRVYKLFLAHAGRKMMTLGYQMHKKSGAASEIPLITPPYALGKGR